MLRIEIFQNQKKSIQKNIQIFSDFLPSGNPNIRAFLLKENPYGITKT